MLIRGGGAICNLMRKRIFTLMRCSCELLQNIIRNIDTDTIRFFWSSCTNVVFCVLWEVGFWIECVLLRLAYLSRTTCFQYIQCKYTKHFFAMENTLIITRTKWHTCFLRRVQTYSARSIKLCLRLVTITLMRVQSMMLGVCASASKALAWYSSILLV